MMITRRSFLRSTAAAGAGAVVATPAVADADPRETIERLAAELAAAMQAVYPEIEFYSLDHEHSFFLCSSGMKRGTRISGRRA